jgi:hypothetical protein
MTRGIRLAAVAWLVLALPATAQQAGTIEVGAFARYVDFDNTLGMGDAVAVGGRAAVYLEPRLALELDAARASAGSVTYTPVHLRAVHNAPAGARLGALVGAGYVRNWYGAPYGRADQGSAITCSSGCGFALAPTWTPCSTRRTIRSSAFTTATGESSSAPAWGSGKADPSRLRREGSVGATRSASCGRARSHPASPPAPRASTRTARRSARGPAGSSAGRPT